MIECCFIEIDREKNRNILIGNIYRPPHGKFKEFQETLRSIMQKTRNENKAPYLSGDFNINLYNLDKDIKVISFINDLYQYNIVPTINKPTRITRKKSTCIDNILADLNPDLSIKSGIFCEKISDHLPIFIIIEGPNEFTNSQKVKYRKRVINKIKISNISERLENMSWENVVNERSPDRAYDIFLQEIQYLYEEIFPEEEVEVKIKTIRNKWMTKGLIKSSKRKQILYKKFLKSRTQKNENNYKKYTKFFEKLKERAKKNYYSQLIIKHKNDLKKHGR